MAFSSTRWGSNAFFPAIDCLVFLLRKEYTICWNKKSSMIFRLGRAQHVYGITKANMQIVKLGMTHEKCLAALRALTPPQRQRYTRYFPRARRLDRARRDQAMGRQRPTSGSPTSPAQSPGAVRALPQLARSGRGATGSPPALQPAADSPCALVRH